MRSRFQLVTALAAATSMTGCSLFLTRGPSHDQAMVAGGAQIAAAPDCTTSMTWPAIDGVIAGVAALGMISAAGDNTNRNTTQDNTGAVTSLVIIAGVATAGALVGYSRVTKCRRANETFSASYNQTYGGGYPYTAQPQPYQYPQSQQYPYPAQPQQPYYPPQPAYPTQPTPAVVNPTPPPLPPAPPPRPPAPTPPRSPAADATLGTEGDVCSTQSECATGFVCQNNVCLKKK